MSNFESTTITVVYLKAGEKPPSSKEEFIISTKHAITDGDFITSRTNGKAGGRKAPVKSYSGVRKSARNKDKKRRQFTVEVTKGSTILDMKLRVSGLPL
jgi:hypothetical protein